MKIFKNESIVDRLIRIIIGELLLVVSFFWLSGLLQTILYTFSFVVFVTSFTGFCALYKVLGINTNKSNNKVSKIMLAVFVVLFFIILLAGSYYSVFSSKKFFLEDYNKMNQYYKQTLFYTGQNNRDESIKNYTQLVVEYNLFFEKYSKYHPYSISKDKQFNVDIENIKNIIISQKDGVIAGDLPIIHKNFEAVRPIFQDVFKRNGFSVLAVYLVDFHDAMEKILDEANAKSSGGIISVYGEVDSKLKTVEDISNDEERQNIRQTLEELLSTAKENKTENLPIKAGELKSAFVKVYLKRG